MLKPKVILTVSNVLVLGDLGFFEPVLRKFFTARRKAIQA